MRTKTIVYNGIHTTLNDYRYMIDISPLCNFDWYKWIKYKKVDEEEQYLYPIDRIYRCLVPFKNKSNSIIQLIITAVGIIIIIQSPNILTPSDMENPTEVNNCEKFNNRVLQYYVDFKNSTANWVKQIINPSNPVQHEDLLFDTNINQPKTKSEVYEDETDGNVCDMEEVDDIPDLELFLNAEVFFPHNREYI